MKFIRENGVYMVLALVAVVLIFVTVMLQATILAIPPAADAGNESGIWYTVRKQFAELILPAPDSPTLTQRASSNTPTLLLPTNTPAIIILQATVVPPTETPLLPILTPTSVPLTPTVPLPTATPLAPLVVDDATLTTTVPLTDPVIGVTSVDLRIGYAQREGDCTVMTEIVAQLIREHFSLTVATQLLDSPVQLFEALAAQQVDITLCYTDPEDRSLMRTRLGLIRQIGGQYYVGDGYKLQIWANGNSKAILRDKDRCVIDFLEKIDFTAQNPQGQDPATWLQNNQSVVDGWLRCPF